MNLTSKFYLQTNINTLLMKTLFCLNAINHSRKQVSLDSHVLGCFEVVHDHIDKYFSTFQRAEFGAYK